MKILAVKLRAIGDTVIWTSSLKAIKRARPECELHVLTYASNAAVLKGLPDVDRLHLLRSKSHFAMVRRLLRLRSERFDWLLGFHAGTTLCQWGATLTGARAYAVHRHGSTDPWPGAARLPAPGRLEDAISRDYQVLAAMGLNVKREPTEIRILPEEAARAEAQLREGIARVGGDIAKPRFAFLPGAGHALRQYPKDLLFPLIERVKYEGKYQPVVIVDRELSETWRLDRECARLGVPLFDRGSLRDFIARISRAERAFANDSGPGHMAVALGLQTDFVFGPGCVGDWHPYDPVRHPVHRAHVSCRNAGPREHEEFRFCTASACIHHSCMRNIPDIELGQGWDVGRQQLVRSDELMADR